MQVIQHHRNRGMPSGGGGSPQERFICILSGISTEQENVFQQLIRSILSQSSLNCSNIPEILFLLHIPHIPPPTLNLANRTVKVKPLTKVRVPDPIRKTPLLFIFMYRNPIPGEILFLKGTISVPQRFSLPEIRQSGANSVKSPKICTGICHFVHFNASKTLRPEGAGSHSPTETSAPAPGLRFDVFLIDPGTGFGG